MIDAHKVRNYIIPSLEAFPVSPAAASFWPRMHLYSQPPPLCTQLRAYVAKTSHPAQSASAVKTVKQYIEQAE